MNLNQIFFVADFSQAVSNVPVYTNLPSNGMAGFQLQNISGLPVQLTADDGTVVGYAAPFTAITGQFTQTQTIKVELIPLASPGVSNAYPQAEWSVLAGLSPVALPVQQWPLVNNSTGTSIIGAVDVTGPVEVSGNVGIVGDVGIAGSVTVVGNVGIVGDVGIAGNVDVSGSIITAGQIGAQVPYALAGTASYVDLFTFAKPNGIAYFTSCGYGVFSAAGIDVYQFVALGVPSGQILPLCAIPLGPVSAAGDFPYAKEVLYPFPLNVAALFPSGDTQIKIRLYYAGAATPSPYTTAMVTT